MDIRDRRGLKAAAEDSLERTAFDPRKLILLHTGLALVLSLLVTGLDFALGTGIADTGGLGGIGLRSILSTAQSLLRLANMVVLPFWEMGYVFAVLSIARDREAGPRSLLMGFRRWGSVLRATALQAMLYFGIAMMAMYLSVFLFSFTPMMAGVTAALEPFAVDGAVQVTPEAMQAAESAMLPVIWIFLAVYLLLAAPLFYNYRMVNFCLMEDQKTGAFAALRASRDMMRGNRLQLLKLDVSYWWFYAAQGLLVAVCYGDMLLPLLGIELPFSDTVSFFVFYVLSLGLQLALYFFCRNRVEVTYAHAYEGLRQPRQTPAMPQTPAQPPENLPWQY